MILSALGKFLKFIVDGAAKIIAFLLINLGLWLPAVYSIVYLIFCAAAGIKLVGGIISIFFIGLITSFIIGLLISYWVYKLKRRKNKPSHSEQKKDSTDWKKKHEEDLKPNYSSDKDMQCEKNNYKKSSYEDSDYGDLNQKYFGEVKSEKKNREDKRKEDYKEEDFREREYRRQDYKKEENNNSKVTEQNHKELKTKDLNKGQSGEKREESPMIFAMRNDPNMLVHEYSDRFEFFQKVDKDYKYVKTEYKGSRY